MKNKLSVMHNNPAIFQQFVREKDIVSVSRKLFASGVEVVIAVRVPKAKAKAATTPYLRDLLSAGFNQKTAALLSGVSQSFASKLLRR